jgi:ATP-binding cassette subfamily B protein
VLVSHRFSTVLMADLIVYLDGGKIVEHGSHAELLQRQGRYAELFELQAAGYR